MPPNPDEYTSNPSQPAQPSAVPLQPPQLPAQPAAKMYQSVPNEPTGFPSGLSPDYPAAVPPTQPQFTSPQTPPLAAEQFSSAAAPLPTSPQAYQQPEAQYAAPNQYQPANQITPPTTSFADQAPQPFQPPTYVPGYDPAFSPGPTAAKPKRWALPAIVVAALLLLGGGGVLAYQHFGSPKTPDQVFTAALTHAFTTTSLTQKVSDGPNTVTTMYDVSSSKNPRISANINVNEGANAVQLSGYGTMANVYAKVESFKGSETFPASNLNKWIQLRKNGVDSQGASTLETLSNIYDPNFALLGEYEYGNFSASDRKALIDLIASKSIYTYDKTKVTTASVGSDSAYVYKVTLSTDGLTALNKKVAALYGISQTQAALAALGQTNTATMYISKDSQQLIKVTTDTTTVEYSNINQTRLPSEPVATIQYADYIKELSSAATTPDTSVFTKSQDSQRKTDINSLDSHIEAYFAQNGYYPRIRDLNDSSWLAENMKGLDPAVLKDPTGSTSMLAAAPTKGQYSYEYGTDSSLKSCDADITTCLYFKLSATLSDGTTFSKESF